MHQRLHEKLVVAAEVAFHPGGRRDGVGIRRGPTCPPALPEALGLASTPLPTVLARVEAVPA